jgi:hypothetical protein
VGRDCTYRDTVDLLFHDETANAGARANRLWLARAATAMESPCRDQAEIVEQPTSVPLQLPLLEKDLVIQRFMFDFVLEKEGSQSPPGYLQFVPDMYSKCRSGSALDASVQAVAYANWRRRIRATHIMSIANERYTDAIRLTSKALEDAMTMGTDDTLLCCHLLGLWEVSRRVLPCHEEAC